MRFGSFIRAPLIAGVLTLGLLVAAGQSQAAQLFTSPSAENTSLPCTPDDRCKLDFAISSAGIGDEVLAGPGEYFETGNTPWDVLPPLQTSRTLRGEDPAEPPVIHGKTVINAAPFLQIDSGATLSDVEIEMTTTEGSGVSYAYGITIAPGSIVDRSRIDTEAVSGVSMTACIMFGGTIRNTVCRGHGTGDVVAIQNSSTSPNMTNYVINSTAITTASAGFGIKVGMSGAFTNVMNVSNSIARGPTADLSTGTRVGAAIGTAVMNVEYSNWNTYTATGMGTNMLLPDAGNQNGPTAATPLFFDGAAGDFREAIGSPTIDAGLASANPSSITLGGTVRIFGPAIDIGAHEFVPPPEVSSNAAIGISQTRATLAGNVDPNGSPTLTRFEYGKTSAYGQVVTGPRIPADGTTSEIQATLADLDPETTYHYRAKATSNGGGESQGEDLTFTTASHNANPIPALALTGLKIKKRWRLSKGTVVRFRVSRAARVKLTFERKRKGALKRRGAKFVKAKPGSNRIRIKRKLANGKRLVPGSYRLSAVAMASDGSRSPTKKVRFLIRR